MNCIITASFVINICTDFFFVGISLFRLHYYIVMIVSYFSSFRLCEFFFQLFNEVTDTRCDSMLIWCFDTFLRPLVSCFCFRLCACGFCALFSVIARRHRETRTHFCCLASIWPWKKFNRNWGSICEF